MPRPVRPLADNDDLEPESQDADLEARDEDPDVERGDDRGADEAEARLHRRDGRNGPRRGGRNGARRVARGFASRADESPRTGLKRSLLPTIRQLPSYIRLLIGLVGDSRVSRIDRFMVLAAIGYIVSPVDLLPDLIPFLGEVDDIFLLMMALQRLVENAGRRVLLDHWRGDPAELEDLNLAGVVSAAGFFLPMRMRRRLQRMVSPRGRSRGASRRSMRRDDFEDDDY